jgi:hypothetical protein
LLFIFFSVSKVLRSVKIIVLAKIIWVIQSLLLLELLLRNLIYKLLLLKVYR